MEKIDYEVDDFMNYCDYKNLSKKSMKSYEQTLRLFIGYLKDECNIGKSQYKIDSKKIRKLQDEIFAKYDHADDIVKRARLK